MNIFINNPLSQWLYWVMNTIYYKCKFIGQGLNLGYMTNIRHSTFNKFNTIYKYTRLRNVTIGDYTYVAKDSQIYDTSIGKFCCIGANVKTGMGIHPSKEFVSIHPVFYSTIGQASGQTFVTNNLFEEFKTTIIENDVWIGDNVLIMPGVTIKNGAIVAAGSVVTKDVEPFSIVGGIPAKVIRYRFYPDEISMLQHFKWWDKDLHWLVSNKDLFTNIKLFIEKLSQNKHYEN